MTIRLPDNTPSDRTHSLKVLNRKKEAHVPAAALGEKERPAKKGVLVLPTMEGLCFERVRDLMYLEAAGNYTTLYFADGRQVLVCKTLCDMEAMLPRRAFVRIHRSHSINLRFIRKYVKGKGGHVVLENGVHLVVSGGRREAFLEAVREFFN